MSNIPTEPDFETLADWADNRLDKADAERVESQLKNASPETQANARWLQDFVAFTGAAFRNKLPAEYRKALITQFRLSRLRHVGRHALKVMVATLTFDSALSIGLSGARSAGLAHDQRQLIFSTEAFEIALNCHPVPQKASSRLMGQILPLSDTPDLRFMVQLIQADREVAMTQADENGEFMLPGIPFGEYRLSLSSDVLDVETPAFTLSAGG